MQVLFFFLHGRWRVHLIKVSFNNFTHPQGHPIEINSQSQHQVWRFFALFSLPGCSAG
jgi:hypothetical protein